MYLLQRCKTVGRWSLQMQNLVTARANKLVRGRKYTTRIPTSIHLLQVFFTAHNTTSSYYLGAAANQQTVTGSFSYNTDGGLDMRATWLCSSRHLGQFCKFRGSPLYCYPAWKCAFQGNGDILGFLDQYKYVLAHRNLAAEEPQNCFCDAMSLIAIDSTQH